MFRRSFLKLFPALSLLPVFKSTDRLNPFVSCDDISQEQFDAIKHSCWIIDENGIKSYLTDEETMNLINRKYM